MELSKKDKKVARELIEKGLQKEFVIGLNKAVAVLQKWKNKTLENRDAYHSLFRTVDEFDTHIAERYDGMTGSKYFYVLADQFCDELITVEDIEKLSPEVQQKIYILKDLRNGKF